MGAENLYSCKEVAESMGVKIDTVYKWIKRGKVKATKYGFKRYVFTQSQFDELKSRVITVVGGGTDDKG